MRLTKIEVRRVRTMLSSWLRLPYYQLTLEATLTRMTPKLNFWRIENSKSWLDLICRWRRSSNRLSYFVTIYIGQNTGPSWCELHSAFRCWLAKSSIFNLFWRRKSAALKKVFFTSSFRYPTLRRHHAVTQMHIMLIFLNWGKKPSHRSFIIIIAHE